MQIGSAWKATKSKPVENIKTVSLHNPVFLKAEMILPTASSIADVMPEKQSRLHVQLKNLNRQ